MTGVEYVSVLEPEQIGESLIEAARDLLTRHAHFRGRVDHFVFEMQADALIVAGSVPSFYLKQLLQTVLRDLQGPQRIVNRVEVICPNGVSSCSEPTRDGRALGYKRLGGVPRCFPTCNGTPGWSGEKGLDELKSKMNLLRQITL